MNTPMNWTDAITSVLKSSEDTMHYTDIANAIVDQGLVARFGATPPQTVNATLSTSINNEGTNSPFVRTSKGFYSLRSRWEESQTSTEPVAVDQETESIVKAFGMYWDKADVYWKRKPKLLGNQQQGAVIVDFSSQCGVYMLYNQNQIIYVGRTTERGLGERLFEHTTDRLKGRWNRFSWFGLKSISEDGTLGELPEQPSTDTVIPTLEAILIEACEPSQNRKRGDDFGAREFTQVRDEELVRPIVSAVDGLIKSYSKGPNS